MDSAEDSMYLYGTPLSELFDNPLPNEIGSLLGDTVHCGLRSQSTEILYSKSLMEEYYSGISSESFTDENKRGSPVTGPHRTFPNRHHRAQHIEPYQFHRPSKSKINGKPTPLGNSIMTYYPEHEVLVEVNADEDDDVDFQTVEELIAQFLQTKKTIFEARVNNGLHTRNTWEELEDLATDAARFCDKAVSEEGGERSTKEQKKRLDATQEWLKGVHRAEGIENNFRGVVNA